MSEKSSANWLANRRKILKTAGAVGTSAIAFGSEASADTTEIGVYYAPDDSFAATGYREESYYYSFNADDWYRVDFTVDGVGGYSKSNGTWGTTFRNHGYGVLRRYDPDYSSPDDDPNSERITELEGHRISYFDANDGNNSTFGYKYSDDKLGGWPTPEYTQLELVEDVVQELGKIAITELSRHADAYLTARDLYDYISAQFDEENSSTTGENQAFEWAYGGSFFSETPADVTHMSEVDYEQEYGCVSTFYTRSEIYEGDVNPTCDLES